MDQNRLNELEQVEEPFLRQLERLGWRILRGDKYDPASTLRESFSEVIIESELLAALRQYPAHTARGIECIIISVVLVCKEHVAGDLA